MLPTEETDTTQSVNSSGSIASDLSAASGTVDEDSNKATADPLGGKTRSIEELKALGTAVFAPITCATDTDIADFATRAWGQVTRGCSEEFESGLVLCRHEEALSNLEGRPKSDTCDGLSDKGKSDSLVGAYRFIKAIVDGKISAPVLAVLSPLARASQTAKPFLQYAESIGCTIVVLDSTRELPGNAAASIRGVKFDGFEWLKGELGDEDDANWMTAVEGLTDAEIRAAAAEMGPSLVGNLDSLARAYYTRTGEPPTIAVFSHSRLERDCDQIYWQARKDDSAHRFSHGEKRFYKLKHHASEDKNCAVSLIGEPEVIDPGRVTHGAKDQGDDLAKSEWEPSSEEEFMDWLKTVVRPSSRAAAE